MVLPGHPDKVCDQVADAVVAECYRADPQAYCQVEASCWRDEFFLTGGTATRRPLETPLEEIVQKVGREVGYTAGNAVDASRWTVRNAVCQEVRDPRQWTEHTNDQCVVVGYAGYDPRTRYLPPEHFLAHRLREALALSCKGGRLKGQGPDGKLLVRMREEGSEWILEHVLVTIQQMESSAFADLCAWVEADLREAYDRTKAEDRRWARDWEDAELLVNPNGPLVNGGPDGDNGQTGRKLVMDYYGPRVPLGGGALSGKDLTHVDRAGAYAARQAAVTAVATGASECLVKVAYAPNLDEPLDVAYEMSGRGARLPREWFSHERIRSRPTGIPFDSSLGSGGHHYLPSPWNKSVKADSVDR
ncbi:MAG TPA: methionine adenosyltransferase domain-containing protein [Vulgatibacter sp.]